MSSAQPSDEEMRAALEQELRRISVDEMLLQSVVSLVNLAARRAGLAGGDDERDPVQVHTAIEAVRALMPLLERGGFADRVGPIRDALSQLQIAYARMAGAVPAGAPEPGRAGAAAGPGGQGAAGPGAGGGAGAAEGPGAPAGPGRPGAPGTPGGTPPRKPGGQGERSPGPAESSGRLWVPGR